jgi:hypothetical protein
MMWPTKSGDLNSKVALAGVGARRPCSEVRTQYSDELSGTLVGFPAGPSKIARCDSRESGEDDESVTPEVAFW